MAEDFVRRFAEAWSAPTPERLATLLQPDVRLVQPLLPTAEGIDAARAGFARLFAVLDDARADVLGWHGDEDTVFIRIRLSGRFGGRPLAWEAVDHIRLRDGLVAERISYFDPLPLALAIARRPRGWRRLRPLLQEGSA